MVTLAYLFEEIDWNTYVSRLKRINRRKNRKILIQILLNFHDNLKGGLEKQIPQIYTQLKLELDSKPWLSEKEKISTLNLATDIISHWRTNRNTDAVQKVANNFSEAVFVDLNC